MSINPETLEKLRLALEGDFHAFYWLVFTSGESGCPRHQGKGTPGANNSASNARIPNTGRGFRKNSVWSEIAAVRGGKDGTCAAVSTLCAVDTKTRGMVMMNSDCTHYWDIGPSQGPTSKGVCRKCGIKKEFVNSFEGPWTRWTSTKKLISSTIYPVEPRKSRHRTTNTRIPRE